MYNRVEKTGWRKWGGSIRACMQTSREICCWIPPPLSFPKNTFPGLTTRFLLHIFLLMNFHQTGGALEEERGGCSILQLSSVQSHRAVRRKLAYIHRRHFRSASSPFAFLYPLVSRTDVKWSFWNASPRILAYIKKLKNIKTQPSSFPPVFALTLHDPLLSSCLPNL